MAMPEAHIVKRLALGCAAAAFACLATGAAAQAGGFYHEHVYADSFGNLVVYSPSGYKRIVVGRGYLAKQMRARRASGPKVVYLARGGPAAATCHRHAVLLRGRSYMYGLPDNVVPEPAATTCW
jgi:hypothetical protein